MKYEAATDKVISKRMGDEVIIINLENGLYYSILEIGMPIWESVVCGIPVSEINARMEDLYTERKDYSEEIDTFVESLLREGLISRTSVDPETAPEVQWPETYAPVVFEKHEDVSEMVALDPPLPELQ